MRCDLGRFYAGLDDPQIAADLARAAAEAGDFETSYAGRVATLGPAEVTTALASLEVLSALVTKVHDFGELATYMDAGDEGAQALLARTRVEGEAIQAKTRFFLADLDALPASAFALLDAAPELAGYRELLRRRRRLAAHALEPEVERVLAMKDASAVHAWRKLYQELTSGIEVRVRLPTGEAVLSPAAAVVHLASPDRGIRLHVADALIEPYMAHATVLTATYNALADDHGRTLALRRFASPFEPAMVEEDLPGTAIETLFDTVLARGEIVRRFFRFKARKLGIDDFASFDLQATLGAHDEFFSFERGSQLVFEAFDAFHPRFATLARGFADGGHLDVEPRAGKWPGAFCFWSQPGIHPVISLNYNGRQDDVFTLAHELGHGVHFRLLDDTQTFLNVRLGVFNEVPSTFAEMLVFERMRAAVPGREARMALLATRLESAIVTIFYSALASRWEQATHRARQDGPLSADDLGEAWVSGRRELFGDAVILAPGYRWGWARYHHAFHQPFYGILYPVGMLVALALMQRYREQGRPFADNYVKMLEAGVSMPVSESLKLVDLDINDAGLWQRGLDYVESLVDELETL